jgi:hypothetical protein
MNQLFVSNAPWIVGRPALFEYALEDFLGELGRQRPWTRTHVQQSLEGLEAWLEGQQNSPVTLEQVSFELINSWTKTLPVKDRPNAQEALEMFAEYLVSWGWLESCSWLLVSKIQK